MLLLAAPLTRAQILIDGGDAEITVHGFVGSAASMAGASDTGITPFALLYVNAPLSDKDQNMAPSVITTLAALKLPGESTPTSIGSKLEQFKSLEFSVGVSQPVVASHRLNLGVEAGFATRLPGINEPRDQTARWANVQMRFRNEKGFLVLGAGVDQRLTGYYRAALTVTGAVKIATIKQVSKNTKMMGIISSIHGLDAPTYRGAKTRDVVRVALAVGV